MATLRQGSMSSRARVVSTDRPRGTRTRLIRSLRPCVSRSRQRSTSGSSVRADGLVLIAPVSAVQKNPRLGRSRAAASMISLAVCSASAASPTLAFSVG